MKLSNATLHALPAGVKTPLYDRAALTPGIVHVGIGNFHRAHQARFLDDLFNLGVDQDWAIVGGGVRPADEAMRQKLAAQDYLTTTVETDLKGISARVIGSMIDFVPVETGNRSLIEAMSQPNIRIVSMTVTESGYYIDAATRGFDAAHPDILADVRSPESPNTVFGAIIAALAARKARGLAPFTVMCCDNIEHNGDVTREVIVTMARLIDPDLAGWISQHVTFPNSMVDGIVPVSGPREQALVRDRFHFEDQAPVTHEEFRQWVLEDKFCAGRPALEQVGVIFSTEVQKYERMKIRILNGGHALITYPAALLDFEIVFEAMADPLIHAFFRKVEATEILPHVSPVGGISPESYLDLIDRRFSNTAIVDTTRRLGFDGSGRQPKFIHANVQDGLRTGAPVSGLALVAACWARYCAGTTDSGKLIEANDPMWPRLTQTAKLARETPALWLEMTDIYGDLAQHERYATAFASWLRLIWDQGVAAALKAYLG